MYRIPVFFIQGGISEASCVCHYPVGVRFFRFVSRSLIRSWKHKFSKYYQVDNMQLY